MTDTEAAVALPREILADKPGFYYAMTSREYFAEPCPEAALTNSGIKTLLTKTPANFAYEHPAITPDSPEAASTAAKRLGDVCHQLSLDKGRGYAVGNFKAWQSNEAKEFKADAEAAGLTPIKIADYEDAQKMAVVMKQRIREVLKWIGIMQRQTEPDGGWPYETEVVIVWQEETANGPIWCRAMLDVFCRPLLTILDPKFSDQFYPGKLERQIVNMGWDIQSAWYRRGLEALMRGSAGRTTFANILVSPDAPFMTRTVQIEEAWRYSAQLECERAIGIFSNCLRTNTWPGFPAGVETIYAPPWLLTQRMDATAMGDNPFDADGVVNE